MISAERSFMALGAMLALTAVALGAFGAHGLADHLDGDGMRVYQTGVQYHLVHALGLIIVGQTVRGRPSSLPLKICGWAMFLGVLLFSGSLYVVAVFDMPRIGMITPFGGTLLLVSWLSLAVGVLGGD